MSRSEVGGAGEEEEMVVGSRVRTYRCALNREPLVAP